MKERGDSVEQYNGMMFNLRQTFLRQETPSDRIQYFLWAQKQRDLAESVPEDRAYEDFVKWAFADLTPEEISQLDTEHRKKEES